MLSYLQWRYPRLQPWISGRAVVVMREGAVLERACRQHRLSLGDLKAAARQQGIRSLAEVDLAVLEADGRISFFTRSGQDEGSPDTAKAS